MALKIENVSLEENLPTIAAKSETDERFPREDTPPTKAESFIRGATLRTRGRAGRSAEDRLLCKQEALGSNPSRSTPLEVQGKFRAARVQFGPWSNFRFLFGLAPTRWRRHRAREGRKQFSYRQRGTNVSRRQRPKSNPSLWGRYYADD